MIAAVVQAAGPDAVQMRQTANGTELLVPEPRSFLGIPDDALGDVYALMDEAL